MTNRRYADRGSVLLLFPAAFLIILVLGALAIDSSIVFMKQRHLINAARAAANDAITLAVSEELSRSEDTIVIDPTLLETAVWTSLTRHGVTENLTVSPEVVFIPPDRVEITLIGWAPYIITPALPGARHGMEIRATAHAQLQLDDG